MKTFIAVLAGILFVVALLVMVFVVGMRRKTPAVLTAVRRVNRAIFNPWQMKTAGRPGAYASLISHTGRATGRTYQTPVVAVPTDQGYVIALPYGTQSNWVKNVLANGSATVVHTGKTSRVDQPELIPMDEVKAHFPPKDQRGHDFFKVTQCLRVRRVESIDRHAGPTPPSAPGSDIRTDGPVRDDLEASGVR